MRALKTILLLAGCLAGMTSASSQGRYMETADYLHAAFPDGEPMPNTLWVTNEIRQSAEAALGVGIASLRVRYWHRGRKTAWILDEVGKVQPITVGVVVENDKASMVRVLEFRESRGWEVRYPFFTDQFNDARLDARDRLVPQIDSITGATLSVDAVTRVVRLALFLFRYTDEADG